MKKVDPDEKQIGGKAEMLLDALHKAPLDVRITVRTLFDVIEMLLHLDEAEAEVKKTEEEIQGEKFIKAFHAAPEPVQELVSEILKAPMLLKWAENYTKGGES
jgi:hypothetical protein